MALAVLNPVFEAVEAGDVEGLEASLAAIRQNHIAGVPQQQMSRCCMHCLR